ncbi:hypothetical protein Athai_64940 [Actinocatenispora thailandica]|uniref:YokE-like PH domain-containing protein n=1 Tax=Actinocatenispora thailandica TaxID=227318 RepID=A0A7R7I0V4_9ACTN|nr:hypothetical protein [Actinocatenispora thailandica]BCJ38991.1 hypothetical protein Athai_64940 [Actinocatenispora thailandica]
MDTFSLSLLPAAADAGLDTLTVSRHVPVFRRDVGRHDTTLAVAQCVDPDRFVNAGLILLLTRRRLVVTRQSRLFDRVRPLITADLTELAEIDWTARERLGLLDFRFTVRGAAHHLWVRAPHRGQLAHLVGVFGRTFAAGTADELAARRHAPGRRIPRQR